MGEIDELWIRLSVLNYHLQVKQLENAPQKFGQVSDLILESLPRGAITSIRRSVRENLDETLADLLQEVAQIAQDRVLESGDQLVADFHHQLARADQIAGQNLEREFISNPKIALSWEQQPPDDWKTRRESYLIRTLNDAKPSALTPDDVMAELNIPTYWQEEELAISPEDHGENTEPSHDLTPLYQDLGDKKIPLEITPDDIDEIISDLQKSHSDNMALLDSLPNIRIQTFDSIEKKLKRIRQDNKGFSEPLAQIIYEEMKRRKII